MLQVLVCLHKDSGAVDRFIKMGLLEFLKNNFVGRECRCLMSGGYFELFLYIPGLTTNQIRIQAAFSSLKNI